VFGYTREELARMKLSRLFFSREEERRFFRQTGSYGSAPDMEVRFATKKGDPVWVNLSWGQNYQNLMSISVIDIRQQKLTMQTAAVHSTQNRLLMDNAPTSMVVIQNDRVIRTNPAFTLFSGYTGEDLAGKEFAAVVHPDDRREYLDIVSGSRDVAPVLGTPEFRFTTKTGTTKTAAVFFTPLTEAGVRSVVITLVDMSERESLKELIRQDSQRRRGIIINVAHELRTPLQPIIGYLELLLDEPKDFGINEKTGKILERCLKSADRERRIINQMINLSVIDSGKLPVNYSAFSVTDLLKNIITSSGYSMNADIRCDIPKDLSFTGDEQKISIVLDSILSNAINYSAPPRTIKIAYQSHADDTYHRLAITDNGIGITKAHLTEIFEPFQLADSNQLSRKYERIGLSLSIAKKYIQMHGGYISVDSVVNQGSTFTIHIPKTPHEDTVVPESFEMWL
jgi:PAS domain S-box-containing protein